MRPTMQIVCPNCTTAYDVPAAKFGGAGRSVRCARCRTVWVATAAPEPVKKVAAPAVAMVPAVEARSAAAASVPAAAEEFPDAGEFDWSLGGASTEEDAPAPNVDPAGAGEGTAATQDDIDAMWSAAAAEPIERSPSLVPAMLPEADPQPVAQPESIEAVAARRAGKA